MISRLANYIDLFAYDAKYHKSCYCNYISKRHVAAKSNQKSNIICDSNKVADSISDEEIPQDTPSNLSDNQILHRAAEILQKAICDHQVRKSFPSLNEITKEEFESQVPDVLLTFSKYLLKTPDGNTDNTDFVTLANIIMSLYSKKFSKNNLQIGLGLYIYNNVRSRKIIDLLYQMGFSCSYNDVRSMTTALAKHGLSTEKDIYIPYGLESIDENKANYIHASIDNFDVNEENLDGKNTTHSMALVVFQELSQTSYEYKVVLKDTKYCLSIDDLNIPFQKVEHYIKPKVRPEPEKIEEFKFSTKEYNYSQNVNFSWKFCRYFDDTKPFLGWTEYHDLISTNEVKVSNIAYLPFINNPPSEFDTIYTSMLRLVQLAHHLNQKHIVITADLAIYSKAQEILWNHPPDIDGKVTLQLGGMHLAMSFIASIGYLYKDGGLTSMLVESDIYAQNTCKQILEGKQYSRGIRALTLCADALTRLFFYAFIEWNEQDPEEFNSLFNGNIIYELKDKSFNANCFKDFLHTLTPYQEKIKEFEEFGKKKSSTFEYWLSFLKAVDLLLDLLSAERDGNFESHLKGVYETLPYLTAGGRHLYSKWVPIYIKDMLQLKLEHPEMYKYLKRGNFVVKKTTLKKFNCVASDMALEQSINKDCKSSSGVVGFTQKQSALLRWIMTRHILGSYCNRFEGKIIFI